MVSRVKDPGEIKVLLDQFIENHKHFSKGKCIDIQGGGVSLSEPLEKTAGAGVILVGDAARQIDSITGGGVANACLSGEIAGRIIGKATETKDYSKEAMQEYDMEWRKVMEDRLYHSYLAKTKLTEVEPESIDTVVKTMADVGVEEPTVAGILAVLEEHHPEILAEIGDLI